MRDLDKFLDSLNPVQREAVVHGGPPLLILAGAGSGKTRVIIGKVAWLISEKGVDPASILAVTFTNKAAAEMRARAASLAPGASDVVIRTFHSFGAWVLRRNAARLGLSPSFTIYDDDDQVSLLGTLFPGYDKRALRVLASRISRAKDFGLRPENDVALFHHDEEFRNAYKLYEEKLRSIGNADFGDLIIRTNELLVENPEIASRFHDRFRVILVDEYQDSNIAQYEMLRAMAGPSTYVCVVGDDDQSIYRFRGAQIENILTFAEKFPGTDTIKLEQNYRSTGSILRLASAVVARNSGRLGKTLWTENPDGEVPRLHFLPDDEAETELVCQLLKEDIARGKKLDDTAVLYRTNAQSRGFETALTRAGIPYRIVGTLRFYEREEIRDSLAVLKLILNPRDEVSFLRIVNKPARGLGPSALGRIQSTAQRASGNLLLATEYAIPALTRKAAEGAAAFLKMFKTVAMPPAAAGNATLDVWIHTVLAESGLAAYHQEQDEAARTSKIQNLEELANAASLYPNSVEGLTSFLEAIELDSAQSTDDSGDRVTLITMHNTKGLEFPRVIVTGLEEGLFPRDPDDEVELEEERRLFYVALTRAEKELILTTCASRRLHGRIMENIPSRFLAEVPEDSIRKVYAASPAYQAFSGGWGNRRTVATAQPTRQDFRYPPGTRVYHDEYGSGEVVSAWYNGPEEVVKVMFETGRSATFLPKYSALDRIE